MARAKPPQESSSKTSIRVLKNGVKVYLDDLTTLPIPDMDGVYQLKVGSLSEHMSVPPRTSFKLDCGFAVELPTGHVPIVTADEDWSKRGLILSANTFGSHQQRFTVIGHNVGKQILAFDHGQVIGKVAFVPVTEIALIPSTT